MKTNIDEIRDTTMLLFDAVPITEVGGALEGLGVCQHPFTTSTTILKPHKDTILDLTNPLDKAVYRKQVFDVIKKSDLAHCYLMIQTAWKMTWFKFCSPYMSAKDFARYLKQSWQQEENPNQDTNVSCTEAIKYFKQANKKYLMEPEDKAYYDNLPTTLTVYRGVSPGREKYGLSWTADKEKAEWFKARFEHDEPGVLLTATIPKKHAICYINDRDEKEIVVDVFAIKDKIQEI